MSDVTLSSGIRQNLLSLQKTSADLTTTQEALSTGNKVNSAADNPSAFFTSQSLTNSANALSALLDQIGQGQQTIDAATNGLTGLTSLLQQALSTAQQAQQAASGTVNYSAVTGTQAIAADSTQVTSANNLTQALGNGIVASTQSTVTVSAAAITALVNAAAQNPSSVGQTLTFKLGNDATVTATFGAADSSATNTFHTAAGLVAVLNAGGAASGNFTTTNGAEAFATTSSGAVTLTSDDLVNNFAAIAGSATTGNAATIPGTDLSFVSATGSAPATADVTAAALTDLTNAKGENPNSVGQTLVFTLGSNSPVTVTFGTSDSGATFKDQTGLIASLNAGFGSTVATDDGSNGVLVTGTDNTSDFTITGTATTADAATITSGLSQANLTKGSALTISDGSHNSSVYYVAGNASAANGTFTTGSGLAAALNADVNTASYISATANGDGTLTLANTAGSIQVGGVVGSAFGFGTTSVDNNYNTTLAGLTSGSTLTVQVGSNAAHTLTFGSGAGQISTLAGLNTALSAFTDVSATVNSAGKLQLTPTSTDSITIGGTPSTATALGVGLGITTPTATVVTASSTRATLQNNYNGLLTQLNQLAADSGYNGVNLLNENNLTLNFNATGTSSLTINGVNDTYTGLGLNQLGNNEFQDNNTIVGVINNINSAISTVQAQTETFGTNSGVITTRQTFETNMINTLQTGASNLVAADQNQESANLLTEQTQQQLEISALSIANEANQSVLKLFG